VHAPGAGIDHEQAVLSKGALSSAASLTGSAEVFGTPDYLAPEQASGPEVDGRADQYARGCVAFSLLAGVPVFGRDHPHGSPAGTRPRLVRISILTRRAVICLERSNRRVPLVPARLSLGPGLGQDHDVVIGRLVQVDEGNVLLVVGD
jgi:serine/threonine protein kinase